VIRRCRPREAAAAALQGAPNPDLAHARLEETRNLVRGRSAGRWRSYWPIQQREESDRVHEQAKVETARLRDDPALATAIRDAATRSPLVLDAVPMRAESANI
jgi:hypothetical protein